MRPGLLKDLGEAVLPEVQGQLDLAMFWDVGLDAVDQPALPQITLALRRTISEPEPLVQRLAELLTESVQQNLRGRARVGKGLRLLTDA